MTKKNIKKILLFISIAAVIIIFIYILYHFNIIPHKTYTNSDFNIEIYTSQTDMDEDKIDDQTDILKNAKAYIKTKPKYKSKYYAGGYPDDDHGVCTDVVAFSLKNAGYDLMELVNKDILENRDKYNIETIDKNIDFRRVRNLKVYFENTAIQLTTDEKDIKDWQGGDIVIFKSHIGIVSDKRNKNGISLVIHHANPFQIRYEEDILENRNDIIGHYRIN